MRDLVGCTLGHYRIVSEIGQGAMGVVYRAHDERLDRDVAVKVLPPEVAGDPDRLARFEVEARAVARLDHPTILAIHDFGREGGVAYAVTELLVGETLRDRLPAEGMGWPKVAEIGAAIAEGLAAAHGRGVVHRDLKPENIFLTSDGRVKILDFGLARLAPPVDAEAETATPARAATAAGTMLGTVGYMSPEQVAYACGRAGRRDDAARLLERAETIAAGAYVPPSALALCHVGLGDWDEALGRWSEAIEARDPLVMPIKSYPFFDPVRADPRYRALLHRMNLAEG